MSLVPDATVEWAAGLFDGEGCISIYVKKQNDHVTHQLSVVLAMSNLTAVLAFEKVVGCGTIISRKRLTGRKQIYVWKASSRQAEKALRLIVPHLIVKGNEAKVGLDFLEKCRNPKRLPVDQGQFEGREYFRKLLQELKHA